MKLYLRLGLLVFAIAILNTNSAFPYSLERSVVSSGNGLSAGGPWSVQSTTGQSVIGHATGAIFEFHIGFWEPLGFTSDVETPALIYSTSLGQNYPNPFNPLTTIPFAIGNDEHQRISLGIYDVRGALVRTLVSEKEIPGQYIVQWDGTDQTGKQVAAGVYLARLVTENATFSRKLLLVK